MINVILLLTAIILMIGSLFYSVIIALTGNKKKFKMSFHIISLLISTISVVIPTYSSMDFSDLVNFDLVKTVSVNSIISAYPDSPFTVRYTLDGTPPSKNSRLYTDDGITVRKEDIEENVFTIYYQIGIGDLFYFPKVYTREYKVNSAIELYPQKLSTPPKEELVDIDKRLVFGKLTIDDKKGSTDIIDGDISTKQEFKPSINYRHTITFSESNKKDFSRIYLYQNGINKIDITIDNKHEYFCKFNYSDDKKSGLFEVDFIDNIPVNSNITFNIYSSQDHYSISDIWFDYYITQ